MLYSFQKLSQVGLMLNGLVVDNMVVGGPAYNSGQLQQSDIITHIDGIPVSVETVHDALLGSDIPGTNVTITARRGARDVPRSNNPLWFARAGGQLPDTLKDKSQGPMLQGGTTHTIVLVRMATEAIADRRRMFELFTIMKVLLAAAFQRARCLSASPRARCRHSFAMTPPPQPPSMIASSSGLKGSLPTRPAPTVWPKM